MRLGYDPRKDAWNIQERRLSFEDVALLDWATAMVRQDRRKDYGEDRFQALVEGVGGRPHVVVFTLRGEVLWVISFAGRASGRGGRMARAPDPYRADEENPEWTAQATAEARPFAEMFPGRLKAPGSRGGRPPVEHPKVHIGFRLAADVVSGVRDSGPGYNARVEKVLREALARGELQATGDDGPGGPSGTL